MPIESYIATALKKQKRHEVVDEYELGQFDLNILDVSRTFVEKVLSLARVSINDDAAFSQLQQKVRHFYDIHQILASGVIEKFLKGPEFKKTIDLVIEDDLSNPEFKEDWANGNLGDVRLFTETDKVFANISGIFHGAFSDMLYHDKEVKLAEVRKSFNQLHPLVSGVKIRGIG